MTDKIFSLTVRGLPNQSILADLRRCARSSGCMFVPKIPRKRAGIFPVDIGTFLALKSELRPLLERLRLLLLKAKDTPLSIQANGDIVDFRESFRVIEKRLTRQHVTIDREAAFSGLDDTLRTVGICVSGAPEKLAAQAEKGYPKRGPHNLIVVT